MWARAELIQRILDRERQVDAPPQLEPLDYLEQMRQRALEDEKAGRGIVMRNPGVKSKRRANLRGRAEHVSSDVLILNPHSTF